MSYAEWKRGLLVIIGIGLLLVLASFGFGFYAGEQRLTEAIVPPWPPPLPKYAPTPARTPTPTPIPTPTSNIETIRAVGQTWPQAQAVSGWPKPILEAYHI